MRISSCPTGLLLSLLLFLLFNFQHGAFAVSGPSAVTRVVEQLSSGAAAETANQEFPADSHRITKSGQKNKQVWGILGVVFGAISLAIFPPLAIPGLIFSIIAVKSKEPNQKVLGIIGIVLSSLGLLAMVVIIIHLAQYGIWF